MIELREVGSNMAGGGRGLENRYPCTSLFLLSSSIAKPNIMYHGKCSYRYSYITTHLHISSLDFESIYRRDIEWMIPCIRSRVGYIPTRSKSWQWQSASMASFKDVQNRQSIGKISFTCETKRWTSMVWVWWTPIIDLCSTVSCRYWRTLTGGTWSRKLFSSTYIDEKSTTNGGVLTCVWCDWDRWHSS